MFRPRIFSQPIARWSGAVIWCLVIAGEGPCSHAAPATNLIPRQEVIRRLRSQFSSSVFKKSPVGIWVESLDRNEILYCKNENLPFAPASNLKILTTVAALSMLGDDFRYETCLYRTGVIKGDTLLGNLIIEGSGDPTISGRFNDGNPTEIFAKCAEALKQIGIRIIGGDVIGDDDAFADQAIPEGWLDYYQPLSYAAQSSALSFNDNCIDLIVRPGRTVGSRARLSLLPSTEYVSVENTATTAAATRKKPVIRFNRTPGTNQIQVSGTVPLKSRGFHGSVTVENPTLFAATVLKETLQSHGIQVNGQARDLDDLPDKDSLQASRVPFILHQSPPLSRILPTVNKTSHNLCANQLFLTLGERTFGTGGWVESASAVASFLSSIDIDPSGLQMKDGCGLSPLNRVTPAQIGRALGFIGRHPDGHVLVNSLAVMGADGTLHTRLRRTPAEKRVFAKTGYIKGVRALSGYLHTLNGETILFCFLINNAEPVSGTFHQQVDKALLALVAMK